MVAQVHPPPLLPAKSADRPLGGVRVDLNAAVAQEALEGYAAQRIALGMLLRK
jgi:hypothetical protein